MGLLYIISIGGWLKMCQCPFLSTAEEKVTCFKECSFYEYEDDGSGCPFKKIKSIKSINIKDIIGLDGVYDREEDKEFLERIYVKNYF
ncbi:MAG: hypothetical protein GX370_04130 [Clostridia bacterium]|nr:hypothetical protein [Clostridia bacterium]